MTTQETLPPGISKLGKFGGVAAVIGIIAFAVIAMGQHDTTLFWQAYFFGWLMWTCYALGCFGLMLLQTVVRSNWGYPVMRLFEAGAKTLPIMGILLIPILLVGAPNIYPWAMDKFLNPNSPEVDPVLVHRHVIMNVPMVAIRSLIYFGFWGGVTASLTRWSKLQDETGLEEYAQKRTNLAAISMVLHVILVTFAMMDWAMSLEPDWYSTIYGAWFVIAQSMCAMALVTLIGSRGYAADRAPWTRALITEVVRKDWGNMLLMMCMVWAYFSLSQWLIMWNGNLPQEIIFYVHRFQGWWLYVGAFIIIFQFFVPFLALLSGKTKRYPGLQSTVAAWLLFMRFVDLNWQILPIFHGATNLPSPTVLMTSWAAAIAFGGLWFVMFVSFYSKNRLLQIPQFVNGYREVKHHA